MNIILNDEQLVNCRYLPSYFRRGNLVASLCKIIKGRFLCSGKR